VYTQPFTMIVMMTYMYVPVDSSHDHFQNIALVRNDTLMNSLGVVCELKTSESNLPVFSKSSCSTCSLLLHPNLLSHSEVTIGP